MSMSLACLPSVHLQPSKALDVPSSRFACLPPCKTAPLYAFACMPNICLHVTQAALPADNSLWSGLQLLGLPTSDSWLSLYISSDAHAISFNSSLLPLPSPPVFYPLHCKKFQQFSRPQSGCHLPNSPWPGIIKFFQARKSLVSDIPPGVGKIANLFYSVISIF